METYQLLSQLAPLHACVSALKLLREVYEQLHSRYRYWPETHVVENIPMPLEDFNVYTGDEALVQVVAKLSGSTNDGLKEFGSLCGEAATIDLGFQANQQKPELHTHDRYGNRVDEVRFHPAYQVLMFLEQRRAI